MFKGGQTPASSASALRSGFVPPELGSLIVGAAKSAPVD
jgi:hypothetical protein